MKLNATEELLIARLKILSQSCCTFISVTPNLLLMVGLIKCQGGGLKQRLLAISGYACPAVWLPRSAVMQELQMKFSINSC
jgi:hypothetical protein